MTHLGTTLGPLPLGSGVSARNTQIHQSGELELELVERRLIAEEQINLEKSIAPRDSGPDRERAEGDGFQPRS